MDNNTQDIPDHCPNCNATLITGWGKTIGTIIIGCTVCAKIYTRDELKELGKEKAPCGSELQS
jgi:hypothetical protein